MFGSRRLAFVHGLLTVALVLVAYSLSSASDDNHVALVVDFGGGQVVTKCIGFSEPQLSGLTALQRSGLDLEIDYQSVGAAVCRINDTGCSADDCFCACRGGDCVYWSYWHLRDGSWQYSNAGAGQYQLSDGMVDGWVWGLSGVGQSTPPPVVTFADVCLSGPTNTPTATATASITPTPLVVLIGTPSSQLPATAAPTSPATATTALTVTQPPDAGLTTATPEFPATTLPVPTVAPQLTASPVLPPVVPTSVASEPLAPLPSTEPTAIAAPQSPDVSPEPSATVSEAVVGATSTAASIAEVGGERNEPGEATSETTPTALAIVGAGPASDAAGADTSSYSLPEVASTPPDAGPTTWTPYLGFVGIILLLAALALIIRLRKSSRHSS